MTFHNAWCCALGWSSAFFFTYNDLGCSGGSDSQIIRRIPWRWLWRVSGVKWPLRYFGVQPDLSYRFDGTKVNVEPWPAVSSVPRSTVTTRHPEIRLAAATKRSTIGIFIDAEIPRLSHASSRAALKRMCSAQKRIGQVSYPPDNTHRSPTSSVESEQRILGMQLQFGPPFPTAVFQTPSLSVCRIGSLT